MFKLVRGIKLNIKLVQDIRLKVQSIVEGEKLQEINLY